MFGNAGEKGPHFGRLSGKNRENIFFGDKLCIFSVELREFGCLRTFHNAKFYQICCRNAAIRTAIRRVKFDHRNLHLILFAA